MGLLVGVGVVGCCSGVYCLWCFGFVCLFVLVGLGFNGVGLVLVWCV